MSGPDDPGPGLDATVRATASLEVAGEPRAGDRLGRYRLVRRLGAGAMGVVWAARDPQLDRQVAVKLVHPALIREPDAATRLLREARAMAKVSHRNVVAIHDAGQDGERLFITMELVNGSSLGSLMSQPQPRPWKRWLALLIDAGRGLAAAHRAGVIHRDFKPDNVLVDEQGRVCVGDFGVADLAMAPGRTGSMRFRTADLDAGGELAELTTTGALIGTPAYMSPEQLRGEDATPASDQFSFCVTAWEVLFGKRPFAVRPAPGEAPVLALARAVEAGEIEPVDGATVPRRVRDALVRGLSADPARRWPDLPTLLAALTPRRRKAPLIAAGVGVAAIAGAAIVAVAARGSHGDGPGTMHAVPRGSIELKATVELAADGAHVVLTTPDVIVQRPIAGPGGTALHAAAGERFERSRVGDAGIDIAVRRDSGTVLRRWDPATGQVTELAELGAARWLGHVTGGELGVVVDSGTSATSLVVSSGGADRTLLTFEGTVEVVDVSPDGARVALIESRLFDGQIVVIEVATGKAIRSEPIVELTGLAWSTSRRLLYSAGTSELPGIHEVDVVDTFGIPRLRYQAALGWFGQLDAQAGRIVFVDSTSSFRARMVGAASLDLDPARVAAALAWDPDGTWWAWNRTTGDLERHAVDGALLGSVDSDLHGEPANATRAGDIVLVAMRRRGGRELSATSTVDGRRLWTFAPGAAVAARCAADDHPPCYVIVPSGDGDLSVRSLDPATGSIGANAVASGPELIDLAVAADGGELIVLPGRGRIQRIDLADPQPREISAKLSFARAVAYHPQGGLVIAGSRGPSQYPVLRLHDDGREELLAQGESELMFLPRPSPAGDRYLVMGRLFLPSLFELVP